MSNDIQKKSDLIFDHEKLYEVIAAEIAIDSIIYPLFSGKIHSPIVNDVTKGRNSGWKLNIWREMLGRVADYDVRENFTDIESHMLQSVISINHHQLKTRKICQFQTNR